MYIYMYHYVHERCNSKQIVTQCVGNQSHRFDGRWRHSQVVHRLRVEANRQCEAGGAVHGGVASTVSAARRVGLLVTQAHLQVAGVDVEVHSDAVRTEAHVERHDEAEARAARRQTVFAVVAAVLRADGEVRFLDDQRREHVCVGDGSRCCNTHCMGYSDADGTLTCNTCNMLISECGCQGMLFLLLH